MHDSDTEMNSDDDSSQFSKPTKPAKKCKEDSSQSEASAKCKCTRAPNWAKDEEDRVVEKFLENREILTVELKGSSRKGGKTTAEKKRCHLATNNRLHKQVIVEC